MNLEAFSVATFNLYNFQLPGLAMNPGQRRWTKTEFERKVSFVARQLLAIDADIVGLQELWHRDAVAAVLTRRGLVGRYDLLAAEADGSRISCAALVRKGLLRRTPTWIREFPPAVRLHSSDPGDPQAPEISLAIPAFSRPVLRFQVALRDAPPLTEVFVVHLKSKLPTRIDREPWFRDAPDTFAVHVTALGSAISTIRRTAEAAALRVLLTEVMKGTVTPVVVLGDVNDGLHSNTLDVVTAQPNYLVGDARGGTDTGLYTAQTLQEYRDGRDLYYTHVHEDLRESLDHVLVSEQFYDNSRRRLWLFEGLSINNDHLHDADHRAAGSSDHGVVRVGFRYRPAGPR